MSELEHERRILKQCFYTVESMWKPGLEHQPPEMIVDSRSSDPYENYTTSHDIFECQICWALTKEALKHAEWHDKKGDLEE